MTVVGTKHFGDRGERIVYVDADPTGTAVDAPKGSLIVFLGTPVVMFTKDDDGDTTNVTQVGGGGGGGLIPVSSTTLGSAAASVTISGFDSTSRLWLVVLSKLHPVTDNVFLEAEMRLGGSFPSDFKMQYHSNSTPANQSTYAAVNATGAERIALWGGTNQGNDAEFPGRLQILIPNPATTDERKVIQYSGSFWGTAAAPIIAFVEGRGGHGVLSSALDAFKIRYNSGNIAAGLISDVYKYDTP